MKTKAHFYAIIFAAIAVCSACDDDDDERALNDTDRNFVNNAAVANIAEVKLGQLAATKANSQAVKDFGQHMVMEHTTALNELRDIADDYRNGDLPEEMDQQHKQMEQQLMNLSGYSFDSLYMASQVTDHQATKMLFETEVSGGTEARVKAYATKYLPHITAHLQKADSIKAVIMAGDGN
jgi:putative membrane protein